jgi:hypothetical protein
MRRSTIFVLGLACLSSPFSAAGSEADAWKPFDLGAHHRAVSTKDAGAQQVFD